MPPTTPRAATRKVLDALAEHSDVTAAELAHVLSMGRSTVGKALAALEAEGHAARRHAERDGGRVQPARWSLSPATGAEDRSAEPAADEPPAQSSRTHEEPAASEHAAPEASSTPPARRRLGKGELRGLVLAHLRARPGEEFTPSAVASALEGRSAGAVGNALDRLTLDGLARRTDDKPRRYTAGASDSQSTDSRGDER